MKDPDLIYVTARELPPAERPAYLADACEDDKALHAQLEGMLAVADQADAFLVESPDGESIDSNLARKGRQSLTLDLTDIPDEVIGQKIGRYRILERIGEGGCGVVYVAEQTEPVRRRVALKVIKLGMDTKQVVARFEAERQALAMMDHPNIAKVLDGGSTDQGRPYFVMELVRGVKITDYCDQGSLATKERLELFIKVCQAIQHAHQKGIIHRDIKPSNILVTINDGVPVPKVIDFGIAKATEGRLTEATIYTQLHQLIGTPAYMSPEQAEMSSLDIDTRSDIYSLGVLLYELLAGATPFDPKELMASGLDAMRKAIREKEPVRPSTRLATLQGEDLTTTARQRAIEAPKLVHLLKGDLDWIVMKCLEKDRTRRYETANGLAADIKRHLNGEPVLACPPSKLYEFHRMVRRHKVGFAATAAVLFALSAGLVISVWQAVRAGKAEKEQRILRAAAETARSDEAAQRQAAQKAEAEQARQKGAAIQSLYDSLLAEARATRLARRVGYREEVFKLLEQARSLDVPRKNLADLRHEAVACLGDFVGLSPIIFSNTPPVYDWSSAVDPSGKWVAFGLIQGGIQVCEAATGKEVASLGVNNFIFDRLCFDSTGNQLWAVFRPPVLPTVDQMIWSWRRDANGRFQWYEKWALPGAVDLVQRGTEMFAAVVEIVSNTTGGAESPMAKIRLFNVRSRSFAPGYEVTSALPAHYDIKIAHTPDGALLAVETVDTQNPTTSGQITVYAWPTAQPVAHLDSHSAEVSGILSLSPEGKYLAWVRDSGGTIWTLPDLKRVGEFKEYFDVPITLGKRMDLVPVSQQARFRLWDPVRKEDITSIDGSGKFVFAPDESFLLLAGENSSIFSLATPEKMVLPPHADAVTGAEFSPDGTRLASVSKDRVVRVCDARTGRILWETNDLPGAGQCVGFSPDGQWLAVGAAGSGAPCIRDAQAGKRSLDLGTNETGKCWSAQFSRDGRYLAATGEDGTQIWTIERDPGGEAGGGLKLKQVKSRAVFSQSLSFSPDSHYVAFGDTWQSPNNFSLLLWDLSQPNPNLVARDNSWGAQCASFTPDSRSLVIMGSNREIVTLDLASQKRTASVPTQSLRGTRGAVNNFVLSPDGSRLAFATTSMRGVDIWDLNKNILLYSLPEEAGTVYWLAWSSDSRRLAVTRDNGQIGVWNLDVVDQIVTRLGFNPNSPTANR